MPVPDGSGPPAEHLMKTGDRKADQQHVYRDAKGRLLGYILRFEARDGDDKFFLPLTYWRDANGRGWRRTNWPQGRRPLFGLDTLAAHSDAIVLLVEGEKTAEAVEMGPLADAFKWGSVPVIGITWPGGGKAVEHVDFSPLAGRDIVILPDADEPGEKTGDALVGALQKVGVRSLRRWKAPAEAKDGWDIADDIPPGLAPDGIAKSIIEAKEVVPPRLVLTLPEFLATYESPDYLVDGLFQRSRFYALTALTGAGKTAVALLLSVAVADPKRRWKFGPHEVEHGRVLYIARENPEDVKMRLIGMASKMGFDPNELARTLLVIQGTSKNSELRDFLRI
jgi:AAA domain